MHPTSLVCVVVLLVCGAQARDPDCIKQQYWPDNYDCTKYYECNTAGEKILMDCPAGLYWNPLLTTCDDPENVDCSWTYGPTTPTPTAKPTTAPTTAPTPPPTTPPTPPPTTQDPNACPTNGALFPDNYDCTGFYECIGNRKQHLYCPSPLLYNIHIPGCTKVSDCSQVSSTTTQASCVDGDLTGADAAHCLSFYICDGSRWAGPYSCPPDLYWSQKTKGCVQKPDSDCP